MFLIRLTAISARLAARLDLELRAPFLSMPEMTTYEHWKLLSTIFVTSQEFEKLFSFTVRLPKLHDRLNP